MIERTFAAIVLAICALLLLRLLIGARRRQRFDAVWQRAAGGLRRTARTLRHRRSSRRDAEHAARIADAAIRRARQRVDRDGNVYTPKSFRKPPRDKMH